VRNEWKSLGLVVDASGTESAEKGVRIFDTTNPGSEEAGDPDLGAPTPRVVQVSVQAVNLRAWARTANTRAMY
jgi:hypothetical protein